MTTNMSDTLDDYVSDEVREHREWLADRDQAVMAAVDCPRCGQIVNTPCVGTDDDERHATKFLRYSHVERLVAAHPAQENNK